MTFFAIMGVALAFIALVIATLWLVGVVTLTSMFSGSLNKGETVGAVIGIAVLSFLWYKWFNAIEVSFTVVGG